MRFIDNYDEATRLAQVFLRELSGALDCPSYVCIFAGPSPTNDDRRAVAVVLDDTTPIDMNLNDLGNAFASLMEADQPGRFTLTVRDNETGEEITIDGGDETLRRTHAEVAGELH